MAVLHEYRLYNKPSPTPKLHSRTVVWKTPPVGFLKINVDDAYNRGNGNGGFGFVIRDESGSMVAGGAGSLQGLISAEHAEILASSKAVDFVISQGMMPVLLETDATDVRNQLMEFPTSNLSALGRLHENTKQLISLHDITVHYRGRKGNMAAHTMAQHGCTISEPEFFFSTPSFLAGTIATDISSL